MMVREIGDRGNPIWLLGDSNPTQWQTALSAPLDPRHPIRHNIWTSILDVIQDHAFRQARARLDTSCLYIRNAVDDPAKKPKPTSVEWGGETQTEVREFQELLGANKPVLVLCFGAFSFEFARRALAETPERYFQYWGAKALVLRQSKDFG